MIEPFTLGQPVVVKAQALALYPDQVQPGDQVRHTVPAYPSTRNDIRKHLYIRMFDSPCQGVIIGWRRRATGWYYDSRPGPGNPDSWRPASLATDKYHKLWLVAWSLRWRGPIEALAEDIEPLAKEEGT